MRKKMLVIPSLIILFLTSCSSSEQVKTIYYSVENDKITYNKDTNENVADAYVKENNPPELIVKDYNPLSMTITADQGDKTQYYMNQTNSTLMSFLNISSNTSADGKKTIAPQDKTTTLYLLDEKNKDVEKKIESFKKMYNNIVELDNTYIGLKLPKSLNQIDIRDTIYKLIKEIQLNYYNNSYQKINDSTSLGHPVIANDILSQKELYYQYFDTSISSLSQLVDKVVKEYANSDANIIQITNESSNLIKEQQSLKDDYLKSLSQNIVKVITEYQSLAYLDFQTKFNKYDLDGTDELNINIKVAQSIADRTKLFERNIKLPVRKALKIDYSAGVFFSGLYDEDYTKTIEVDGTTTKYKINKVNGNKLSYGAMGDINFHTKYNSWCNWGGSISAGLMFNQSSKLVLAPSLGLFLGRNQRVILHCGVAFARVDRIYSAYGEGYFENSDYTPD